MKLFHTPGEKDLRIDLIKPINDNLIEVVVTQTPDNKKMIELLYQGFFVMEENPEIVSGVLPVDDESVCCAKLCEDCIPHDRMLCPSRRGVWMNKKHWYHHCDAVWPGL